MLLTCCQVFLCTTICMSWIFFLLPLFLFYLLSALIHIFCLQIERDLVFFISFSLLFVTGTVSLVVNMLFIEFLNFSIWLIQPFFKEFPWINGKPKRGKYTSPTHFPSNIFVGWGEISFRIVAVCCQYTFSIILNTDFCRVCDLLYHFF